MCFHCEYSENYPVFVGNIEKCPLLLGKLMVSSKGWRESQLSTALSSVVGESCICSQYTTRPYLATRKLGQALKMDFQTGSEKFWHKPSIENRRNTLCISRFAMGRIGTKEPLIRRKAIFSD